MASLRTKMGKNYFHEYFWSVWGGVSWAFAWRNRTFQHFHNTYWQFWDLAHVFANTDARKLKFTLLTRVGCLPFPEAAVTQAEACTQYTCIFLEFIQGKFLTDTTSSFSLSLTSFAASSRSLSRSNLVAISYLRKESRCTDSVPNSSDRLIFIKRGAIFGQKYGR